MDVRALLNPTRDDEADLMLTAPHSTELAAASLMLLGACKQDATSALSIVAARSENTCSSDDGLCTPLATSAAVAQPSASASAIIPPATAPSARSAAPHMSPVADKHQHAAVWITAASSKSTLQHVRPTLPPRHDLPKRPRRECASKHTYSTISDLFSSARTASADKLSPTNSSTKRAVSVSNPSKALQSPATTTATSVRHKQRQAACSDKRSCNDDALQGYTSSRERAMPPGAYCAVAGCLRAAHELAKCTLHKGLKLCSASECFRPVQSRGFCKSHGGGARCKHPDCTKGAISKGRCRTHGGGTRCAVPNCSKWAQRLGCCVRHSKALGVAAAPTGGSSSSSSRAVVVSV